MISVTATEFARRFERYKELAQREPVAITDHGRISGYFVSACEYAESERLRAIERRVYRLRNLPAEIADAIEAARMDPAHDHINELLDDD